MPGRVTDPTTVERVLRIYADVGSIAATSRKTGISEGTVRKYVNSEPDAFTRYRTMRRLDIIEAVWGTFLETAKKVQELLPQVDTPERAMSLVERLHRIIGIASGMKAEDRMVGLSGYKGGNTTQTTIVDANSIRDAIRSARDLDAEAGGNGSGTRMAIL